MAANDQFQPTPSGSAVPIDEEAQLASIEEQLRASYGLPAKRGDLIRNALLPIRARLQDALGIRRAASEEEARRVGLSRIFEEQKSSFLEALKPQEAETRRAVVEQLRARGLLSSPLSGREFGAAEAENLGRRAQIIGGIEAQKAGAELNRQIQEREFQQQLELQRRAIEQAEKERIRAERQADKLARKQRRSAIFGTVGQVAGTALGGLMGGGIGAVGGSALSKFFFPKKSTSLPSSLSLYPRGYSPYEEG